ncbi:cell division/cell wall cluster transcriptional repressor MraZ [Roseinatronobacter sp.]|uniref:division/cell wall cluster transcriptional repressor MraZ n=1 Tax=Roseinatronobacter sp. TaxID=1945755 RepID=UPI0025F580FE|nr:cell division/cell wall cluster transcriptional repressor MraZ [Rhodobaca sp.]
MARRFRSTFHQKVDGKGRVSVPASFRRVIEQGDPDWKEGLRPNFIIVAGLEYQKRLDCFTITAMEEIEDRIDMMQPGSSERSLMELTYHANSIEAQIDEDGRIILPNYLREKLDLDADEKARFMGRNDHFQIWKETTFEATYSSQTENLMMGKGPDYDPRVLLPNPSRSPRLDP